MTVRRAPRIRLIPILLALVVLLAALNGILLVVKPLLKPGVPASGQILYASGFEDSASPEWEQYRSAVTAQLADGRLSLIADSAKDNIFAPLAYTFRDFDLRVAARQTFGEDPFSEYGVLFRYQDKRNFYIFRVRSDGSYRVSRAIDGKQEDLSTNTDPERFRSPLAVGLNWMNDLRIVAKGDRFQFYINGQQLTLCPKGSDKRSTWDGERCVSNGGQTALELVDSTFADGRIALSIYENTEKVAVDFDNLVMIAP